MAIVLVTGFNSCKKCPDPVANFYVDESTKYGLDGSVTGVTVVCHNNSTDAGSYVWDFGDGTVLYSENPSHTYTSNGSYTITLNAQSNCGDAKAQETKIIDVWKINDNNGGGGNDGGTLPTANFSFTGSNQYAPAVIYFTNNSSNANSYQWDFGDGSTSTSTNPSHTYSSPGTYTVTLKAINGYGNNIATKVVNVKNNPTNMTLTKLTLTKYPETEDGGDNWDWSDAGPDIYFEIYKGSNKLYTSTTKNDLTLSSLPVAWNCSVNLSNINDQYTIKFYDEDGALDPDDLMASMNFTPSQCGFNNTTYSWSFSSGKWTGSFSFTWN